MERKNNNKKFSIKKDKITLQSLAINIPTSELSTNIVWNVKKTTDGIKVLQKRVRDEIKEWILDSKIQNPYREPIIIV